MITFRAWLTLLLRFWLPEASKEDFFSVSFKASSNGFGGDCNYDLVTIDVVGIIWGRGGEDFFSGWEGALLSSSLSSFSDELPNLFFFFFPFTDLRIPKGAAYSDF